LSFLWLQALRPADARCIAKAVPVFAAPGFPGFLVLAGDGGIVFFVNHFPDYGNDHHLVADP